MELTEESVIHLGAGTHYIQTNYGDSPYLPTEQDLKCDPSFRSEDSNEG